MANHEEKSGLNIIFAGTPEFSARHLRVLIEYSTHNIVAVYTQPDRQSGRGKKVVPTPVKQVALEHDIPVFQPLSLKGDEEQHLLRSHNADLMVVVAYGLILPQPVLDAPRLGCINVHASILPRWRGAAPIERAIEAGDAETGITIMHMDIGLDTGDMISKVYCPIDGHETGDSLREKMIPIGQAELVRVCNDLLTGNIEGEQQEDSLSNYAPKLSKQEGLIDWSHSAQSQMNKIHAFNSSNVCYTDLNGERIKVWQVDIADGDSDQLAGTIIECSKKRVVVQCAEQALVLKQLQLPGKKAMDTASVLNSRREWFAEGNRFD
ncbi:Methionyl-tRNA formyltransferase [Sinobacterium norvegicum]|uniref:Methionyl-tRNA formyltransferase n=1 Tax=Sinobacterium norvegicum TaxID=1641715 RepID=A0ABM9AIH8_9GAMM|nr:methionyl-tRNA formyltransferase [Sinobacterium norvegicum]CAH0993006.1 Methionyl-tRNA formyltransferase [Sinobacterium norvegicum]